MSANSEFPLVVDLDGTLVRTDTLVESLIRLLKQSPIGFVQAIFCLLKGRAAFKNAVASRVRISPHLLPYRQDFLDFLKAQKAAGRRMVLATAAHQSIARGVADHLGIFDLVMASDSSRNLKSEAKLSAVRREFAEFSYAGDSADDIPLLNAARSVVLVGVSKATRRALNDSIPIEREFINERPRMADWRKALRLHQWVKNLLLLVPLITAFSFTALGPLLTISVAFMAYSLVASATYLVNDLWDLESDRAHPRKRHRPFASARIPIGVGLLVAAVALVAGFTCAAAVSPAFTLMLAGYLLLTTAYSTILKTYVLLDVVMLSLLYVIRILSGAVAIGVNTSSWLLAFSGFLFLSLALVKRCSELIALEPIGEMAARGRDYRVGDMNVLQPLGISSALAAVVVFGLFINAPETQLRYATPELLWLIAIGLFYWLGRLWIKTARGEMDDDPVIYAIKDRASRIVVVVMVAILLSAHFQFPLMIRTLGAE